MSTNDNYMKTTLTVVGLGLQRCTCKVVGVSYVVTRFATALESL
jgi:hypothetical protein